MDALPAIDADWEVNTLLPWFPLKTREEAEKLFEEKYAKTYEEPRGYSDVEQWQPKDFPATFRMYQLNLDGDEDRVFRKYWDQYPNHFVENIGGMQK